MTRYMLDTNSVSQLIGSNPIVGRRVAAMPFAALSISSITEGEMLFGLAKRPDATRLHRVVSEFLLRVDSLPWDGAAAASYGRLRADCERRGAILSPLDMLIAAHAHSVDAISGDQ